MPNSQPSAYYFFSPPTFGKAFVNFVFYYSQFIVMCIRPKCVRQRNSHSCCISKRIILFLSCNVMEFWSIVAFWLPGSNILYWGSECFFFVFILVGYYIEPLHYIVAENPFKKITGDIPLLVSSCVSEWSSLNNLACFSILWSHHCRKLPQASNGNSWRNLVLQIQKVDSEELGRRGGGGCARPIPPDGLNGSQQNGQQTRGTKQTGYLYPSARQVR